MCRSTCFGRVHAHHQELTTALTASGFTLERGGSRTVGRGLAGRPDHDNQQLSEESVLWRCVVSIGE
jgi:hypothetical protein